MSNLTGEDVVKNIGSLPLVRMARNLLVFLSFTIFAGPNFAYEVVEVCAEYKNTGKRYKVEANVFDGSELNSRTGTFNYDAFSKYAVIFWGPGQATVIKLDLSFGGIGIFGSRGKDQGGYPWELSTSTTFCF